MPDDALVESGRAWSRAWCDTCRSVQEIELTYMEIDERNVRDALDLTCTRCRTVIATLHESTPATS